MQSGYATAAPLAKRESHVDESLSRLAKQTQALDETIHRFINRLDRIVRQEPEGEANEEKLGIIKVPLANAIDEQTERLNRLQAFVEHIETKIEL